MLVLSIKRGFGRFFMRFQRHRLRAVVPANASSGPWVWGLRCDRLNHLGKVACHAIGQRMTTLWSTVIGQRRPLPWWPGWGGLRLQPASVRVGYPPRDDQPLSGPGPSSTHAPLEQADARQWNDLLQVDARLPFACLWHSRFRLGLVRSEERRVGQERRSRWSPYH